MTAKCTLFENPHNWLLPQWQVPSWVRAVCTTRSGGVSGGAWASMNMADHVQDDAQAVAHNRRYMQQLCGMQTVFLQQVHGTAVHHIQAPDIAADHIIEADACYTQAHHIACTVMVADCLPVLLVQPELKIVAAAHAGWRGLAGKQGRGVLEAVLAQAPQPHTSAWVAWLGPCIGAQAFEVGDAVRSAFVDYLPQAASCFMPVAYQPNKWLADLAGLARLKLQAYGIQVFGNDGSNTWCTASQPQQFFSYRRDSCTGRMAAAIWIDTSANQL